MRTKRTTPARLLTAALILAIGAGIGWWSGVRPLMEQQARERTVLATAGELRSTSRALQRDVLLLIFDEATREKTQARVAARVPTLLEMAGKLEAAIAPDDAEKGARLNRLHHALGHGFLAVAAAVREGDREYAWGVQQERVLANEIPAARTNDPVIEYYGQRVAGHDRALRLRLFLVGGGLLLAALVAGALVGRRAAA